MSPYLVFETDSDKQKTDVADDAGDSAAWTGPVRLSGNGTIKASALLDPAECPVLHHTLHVLLRCYILELLMLTH